MPQGLGLIGVAVAGAFGAGSILATSLTAIAIGAVTSAVVGAAIGGLTAAITGGDIGKGLLFGAIGGVVTGGLAGGQIVGAIAPESLSVSTGAIGQGAFSATTDAMFAAGATEAGGGALSLGTQGIMAGTGPALVNAFGAGLTPEEELPYSQTKEGYLEGLASQERQTAMAANKSTGAEMPWPNTEAGAKYLAGQEYKINANNNAARMAQLEKQYALGKEQTTHEFNLSRSVYANAAEARGSTKYQSGVDKMREAAALKGPSDEPETMEA